MNERSEEALDLLAGKQATIAVPGRRTRDSVPEDSNFVAQGMERKTLDAIDSVLLKLPSSVPQVAVKVYKRRWLMLLLFCLASMCNASHWLQYSIITNVVMKYYNVSAMLINWTSMIFMAVYIPFVFPATWVLEKKGLRFALILGSVMMTVGAWLKLATLNRDSFYLAISCQLIVGTAQIFMLSAPAYLAGLWFGENQRSTACAFGVFGNQLGIALSFLVPPEVVSDSEDMDQIRGQLLNLYLGMAIAPTIVTLLILILFQDKPPRPPSVAQAKVRQGELGSNSYAKAMVELVKNKDFDLLALSYGANVGVFYAYSTLLNQLILIHFPHGEEDAGQIGLTLIIGGMFGAVVWGMILDKTHHYKNTTIVVYSIALLGMLGFTAALHFESLLAVYITSGILGVFMNGYLPVAYEFAAELTYPLAESTSSGVLNAVGELVGVALVQSAGFLLDRYSDTPTNLALATCLAAGLVLSFPISSTKLRRLAVARGN